MCNFKVGDKVKRNGNCQMKKFLTLGIVAACVFLLSEHANAEETTWSFGVHTFSKHTEKASRQGYVWNNENPGFYVRRDNLVVGTYYNSERKQSVYAGYVYSLTDNIDITVGAISGYRAYKVAPLVVPSFHFPLDSVGLHGMSGRISVIPPFKQMPGVVHFSIEARF